MQVAQNAQCKVGSKILFWDNDIDLPFSAKERDIVVDGRPSLSILHNSMVEEHDACHIRNSKK